VWYGVETSNHLFLHCSVASRVWMKVSNWLDFNFLIPPNLFIHCQCWNGWERNKKVRCGLWLIWHATVWMLWRARNNRILKDQVSNAEDIVEVVEVLSWRWSFNRIKIPVCLFYEWCWNPKDCLKRDVLG